MNLKQVTLTPDQKKKWSDTMSLMAWTAPGFRHLWYRLLQCKDGDYAAMMAPFTYGDVKGDGDKTPAVACTDGENIICNPDTFFKYNVKERVFIGAHEVAHCVYDDCGLIHRLHATHTTEIKCTDGKIFPYKPSIMARAMDYRINAMLVESRIGVMPPDALYDPEIAKGKEGIYDIYGRVYKHDEDQQNGNAPAPGSKPGTGNAQGNNGFDATGPAPPGAATGKAPGQAVAQRNPQQWAVEVAMAAHEERRHARGDMPGSLQHMFDEILEPKVDWTNHIETICKRIMGGGSYNWKKPDRRFIGRDLWLPGRGGTGAGWLVIWGDTSGSIGEKDLNRYLGEMRGLIEEMNPERLTVIWCDAEIHHVDEVEDVADLEHIKARGVGGRGGTSIKPVFDHIADNRDRQPDMFIGMTDGEFDFPEKPSYPVIWASIHNDAIRYPYGEVVPINT